MKKIIFLLIIILSLNYLYGNDEALLNRLSSLYMQEKIRDIRYKTEVDVNSSVIVSGYLFNGEFFPKEFIPFSSAYSFYRANILNSLWDKYYRKKQKENTNQGVNIDIPVNLPPQITGIIGEGVNLKISGSDKIEVGGSKDMDLRDDIPDELKQESLMPQLDIKQHFQVNLTGTIGQKIYVNIKHDSEAETSWDNNIKLWYTGDEDEIVQSIEAGNVSIALPGTRLIGSSAGHQGLFGLKSTFKLGPLNVAAVMSRDEGESKDAVFSVTSDSLRIEDKDYIRNQFFILNEPSEDSIIKMFVYVDDGNVSNDVDQSARFAYCYYYPDTDSVVYTGTFEYKDLNQEDYYYIDRLSNILVLNSPISSYYALGVSYIIQRSTGEIDTVGYVFGGEDDTLRLKMLKPPTLLPSSPAWNYQLRNIYSIPIGILPSTLIIKIYKRNTDGSLEETYNGVPYVRLLGITDDQGEVKPEAIDFVRGRLIFPWDAGNGRPFDSNVLPEQVPEIYDSLNYSLYGGKYVIDVRYYKDNSEINLGVVNVIKGSEEIKINDIILKKDVDYSIDYDLGIVRIFDLQKYGENPDITIDYQYMPMFSMANKSFLGLRTEFVPSDKLKADAAIIYSSQFYPQNDYPEIGEEDNNIILGESGLSFKSVSEGYGLLNYLPGINNTKSDFSVDLRGAFSRPDPSTRGVGYIDNMENVLTTMDINTSYDTWHYGSVPEQKDTSLLANKFIWYNVQVPAGYINPSLPTEEAKQEKNVLNVYWETDSIKGENGYVSIQQCISKTGYDFSTHKYIEVWVRNTEGNLHIDLGNNIPEDAARRDYYGNIKGIDGILNSEDFVIKDGQLNEGEDVGLDGVEGDDNLIISGDDRNDDYYYTLGSTDYSHINGTENNNKLDTEDLDGNGSLNLISDYFEFNIDLSSNEYEVLRIDSTGWRLLRVPIDTVYYDIHGSADWHIIRYARLWLDGAQDTMTVSIGGISIVGNKWRDEIVLDPNGNETNGNIVVTVKNNQLDPDYVPPYDPGYDMYLEPKKEQSLVLRFSSVAPKDKVRVWRIDTDNKDYTRYNGIRFYVRGENLSSDAQITLKMGSDSLNYYYMKGDITNDIWKDVSCNMMDLINLKKSHLADSSYSTDNYGFKGNPSFTSVKYIIIEVANNSAETDMSGEVWVDDIRLYDPNRTIGYAGIMSASWKWGDFIHNGVSFNITDPYFTRSKDRPGSNYKTYGVSYNSGINLNSFLPSEWRYSLPVNFSYGYSKKYPIKYPNSDMYLDSADIDTMGFNEDSKRWSLSTSFRKTNSSFLLWKILLDRTSATWSTGYSFNRRWNAMDSSRTQSYKVSYNLTPSLKPLKIFKWDFRYYPNKFTVAVSGGKSKQFSYIKTDSGYIYSRDPLYKENIGGNLNLNYSPLNILSFSFSGNLNKDKKQPHDTLTWFDKLGREINRNYNYSINFSPKLGRKISFRTSYSGNYGENHDYNLVGDDSLDVRNANNRRNLSFSANMDIFSKLVQWGKNMERDTTVQTGDPKWVFTKFTKLISHLSSPSARISFGKYSSYTYIGDRPDLLYQFAIIDTVPSNYFTNRTSVNRNHNFSFNTSESFSWNILSVSLSYDYSKSLSDNSGNLRERISYTWPSLNFNLSGFNKLPFINKFVSNLSFNSGYNIRYSFTSNPLDTTTGENRDKTINYSPAIGINFSFKKGMNGDYRYNISEGENLSPMPGGEYTGRRTLRKMHSATMRYSFRSPTGIKLPFMTKRLKFKNNLDVSVRFDYTDNKGVAITATEDTLGIITVVEGDTIDNSKEWTVAPQGSYNFSSSFSGGFKFSWTHRENPIIQEKRRKIAISIWGMIKF